MAAERRTLEQHLANDGRPKRILALDGGGLRGILTLGILEKIEADLRKQHNDEKLLLSDYFDLIAGTSTGAIIAAALAMGWTVSALKEKYFELGTKVFKKDLLRKGIIRAKYDDAELKKQLRSVYGADTLLESPKLLTGLLVVTKRRDTASWWPIGNNPRGKYFGERKTATKQTLANSQYPLWQVVRASTAAPSFFESEDIQIGSTNTVKEKGEFVDGGMSPFNNPALMAVMYATLEGYRVNWETGADKLLVVSVGTGRADKKVKGSFLAAGDAVTSLLGLMDDCAQLQEQLLQWMSASRTARVIDREVGNLANDLIAPAPLISYLRYNGDLGVDAVKAMLPKLDVKTIESLTQMDIPGNMDTLYQLGKLTGARDVLANDFPTKFDLAPG